MLAAVALMVGTGIFHAGIQDDPNPEVRPSLAEYYGFLPPEIYKLDSRLRNLITCDLDGDGTADVAVVNNAESRISLLLSSPEPEGGKSGDSEQKVNELLGSQRMRTTGVQVNKEVISLRAGDFDNDGAIDLAFYGTPSELVVLYNSGKGTFGDRQRKIAVGDALPSTTALAVGDLNRDGLDDLILATSSELITILQREDGRLGEPERLPHTASDPSILRADDLDGDGGDDLILLDDGPDDPIRVRFSVEDGELGPEERFQIESPRAIEYADVDGEPGVEVLTIESQSGRVRIYKLAEGENSEDRRGRLIFFPLPAGNTRGRALAIGDLDGDQKADVVVTDPANAQFVVYNQGPNGLVRSRTFPNLAGGQAVVVADLDGDGKGEVIVLSEKEKQIGRSLYQDDRLTFPAPLPTSGDPLALDAADLDGDKTPEVLYIVKAGEGSEGYTLRGLKREESGTFVPVRWGQSDAVAIPGLNGTPTAMRVLDVNRDGFADILIFKPYGSPILLIGRPGGEPPAPSGGSLGPLVAATPSGISRSAPGGAALLVAQNTFARSVVLSESGQWEVRDQFNSGRGSAQVIGAAVLNTDDDEADEVVLLDRSTKSLLFLDERDGAYRPAGTLSVGSFDFQGTHVADLDGDGRDDLLLAGTDKFGVVLTGKSGQQLKPIAGYETARDDVLLSDLIVGDVNHDGRPDVVLTDVGEHALEIVQFDKTSGLERALAFKVFEKKSFRDVDSLVQPREIALGDVDGDKRTDIVLIVHDRILIYRQDNGESKPSDSEVAETAKSSAESDQ